MLGMRILLVEDSVSNRLLIQSYVKKMSCDLDLAENGEIAVDMFKAVRYDLVLMDMEMPVMDGHTATREIRQWERACEMPPTPIIALTAHETKEEMCKSLEAGCTAHLIKPIKKEVFLQALHEYTNCIALPLRILLAEDSISSRIFIQAYFKETPHQIEVAENGQIAVEKYKAGLHDLVLMDMEMPVMDGYAATREIRQWERACEMPPAPILALTAHETQEEARKSLEAGCTAHLIKPIKKAALLAALSEHARSPGT